MAKNKKAVLLIVAFICLIVTATVMVLLLTPFGKQLLGFGKNGEPMGESTTESVVETIETSRETLLSPEEIPSVSIPKPTAPEIDTDKNYTFFVDKKIFDQTQADGVTTLTAKENKNVVVTVTPYKTVSYAELCTTTAKLHAKDSTQPKLNTDNLYAVYHSEMNGTTTTVYCIDDGNGGSIKLKLERPAGATEYDKHFEILVSMFKVK